MNAQDLRNSILQLAVQGKLVEQREEEGTAEELYKQIQEEKKKLIKDGKIRKQKSLPPIIEEEIPFEIPESWIWGRLEVLTYSLGNKSNQIKQREIVLKGLYPVVSQSMNTIEGYSNQVEKLLKIEPLSVIVFGDHSKTLKLIDFDFIIGADGTKILVPILLNPKYIYYILQYNLINMRDRGYSRHFQFLKEKLIPVPPLLEQQRIVEKIEELMPFVEKYDIAHTKLEKLNKNFPEDIKKSILQYAVQGKLVEQREEDGTAEELYKQIQEEKKKLIKEGKIRKQKALPPIKEDEIPFEIPESWKWVRLGDVIQLISGQDFSRKKYNEDSKGIPYLTGASNINDGVIIFNRWTEEPRAIAIKGDLLLTCKGTVGKTTILNEEQVHIARQFMALRTSSINIEYLHYFIMSYVSSLKAKAKSIIPGIERRNVLEAPFPLPTFSEQKRIVDKINGIMGLIVF